MVDLRSRLLGVWRRTFSLSWPLMIEQTFNTMMRTTDIIVTGLFSPAAVAAIGLADLYAQIPLRLGLGFGGGAIALSSQDTGRGAVATRDEAITQALLIGFIAGLPLVAVGLTFGREAIALLGAPPDVARMGGLYLALVFAAAPARITGLVGSRALQGTGDTRTPMYVNITSNIINIVGSVVLGLGLGPAPRLGVVGVGLGTFAGRVFGAGAFFVIIGFGWTTTAFVRPRYLTTTRQLVAVSVPHIAEGMSQTVANFPFNALLLGFGTEVNAAYHIGRRMYQQLTGPLYRAYSVAASILVGQTLGEGDPDGARFNGLAIAALGVLTLGLVGAGLVVGADVVVRVFTSDPATIGYAAAFARVFGAVMVFFGLFFAFAGALRGAGDTRTPFYARLSGTFGFTLGFSYVVGVVLGYGLVGVYLGLGLTYVWWALVVTVGFLRGDWADQAAAMMAERDAIT